jgi:hypothetical protein
MAPKKVNLQWIAHESIRKATFTKRRNALMKKVSELVTLCGVSVVMYGDDKTKPPEVYPSVPEARRLLSSFKTVPDNLERFKRKVNHEEYLHGRISKLQNQIFKSDRQRGDNETSRNLHEAMVGNCPIVLAGLTNEDLIKLDSLVQSKIMDVKERFKQLGIGQDSFQEPLLPTLSSQVQSPYYTYSSEIQPLVPAEEPQPQQNWPVDYRWNDAELGSLVYNDLGICDGDTGPSCSSSWAGMHNGSLMI